MSGILLIYLNRRGNIYMQSKKRIVVVSITLICMIACIIHAFNGPLYKQQYSNHAWGYRNYGYVIYKNEKEVLV